MKTVKFNEEEIELLVALYEDELKEAGSYIDKLQQTLGKLKKQADKANAEPTRTGKKRGRKPKNQLQEKPVTGKKRGRKPKAKSAAQPEVKVAAKKAPKKRRTRRSKVQVTKPRAPKLPKVEKPVVEEIKTV